MSGRRVQFDIRQARKPLLIVAGVWLVICVAAYLWLVRPKVQEYRTLEQGSAPQREALLRNKEEAQRLESFVEALNRAEADLKRLRDDVLSTRDRRMVEVQLEVARLCEAFSIDLESVSFESEELFKEDLDRLVMVVPLEGGYTNLRKFLQAVEESDKFLLVERVALAEGREGGVMLQLNITLATYFDLPEELQKRRGSGGRA